MARLYRTLFLFAALFTFVACGGEKGKLTITNIAPEYQGRFAAGQHIEGHYVFVVGPPTKNYLQGAEINGSSVTLNVYPWTGEATDIVFTGKDEILLGNFVLILMNDENVHNADNVRGFINTKVIKLKNGSAEIDLVADMKKL